MYKQFKELLLSNAAKPMPDQKELLDITITAWIGNDEQTDDITVFRNKNLRNENNQIHIIFSFYLLL